MNFKFDFKIPSLLFVMLLSLSSVSYGQLSYSCDMGSGPGECGRDWDINGFADGTSYSGGCAGNGLYDNVWSSNSAVEAYSGAAITGHTGGSIILDFQTKLRDYYSPYTDNASTEWGTLKVYWKASTPSAGAPGTQIGSDITSATDCQVHTINFDPGGTVTNLYIMFVYTLGSGDNWIIFDNVNLTEVTCAEPTLPTSSSITSTAATISWTAPGSPPSNGYDYYYSTSATTPDNATTPSGSVAAGVVTDNLSGLTPGFTYYYWVRSDCGASSYSDWVSGGTFTCDALIPTVTSFTPSNGCASFTPVVITGTNFGGTSAVTIGATAVSSYTVDSDTQITATVGSGTTGVIQVTNSAGSASSSGSFTFNSAASITTNPEATLDIVAGNSDVISVVASSASSYQWQFSEDGTTGWGDIVDGTPLNVTYSGANTASLTVQPNTSVVGSTGYYKCVVQCGSISSANSAITFVQYCDAGGGALSGITGVSFSTLDNTSGNSFVPAYTDYYDDYQAVVYRDSTYDLDVYADANGAPYTNYQTAWIDWDGNGTFDVDEEYDLGTVTGSGSAQSSLCAKSIIVPADAIEGNVRMRVLSRYNTTGTSCATGIDGEIEDYAVLIRFPNLWEGDVSNEWEERSNWTGDILPSTLSEVTIPDVTNQPVITSAVAIENLTIDASADITISSNSLTVSGSIDNNGILNIGNGTVNADGDLDATTGIIDMTNANANLVLSSTATSLGTLNAAEGTVTYDGGTQNVLVGTYNNLSISNAGVKTAQGNINVNGNLTTGATNGSRLDMVANQLNLGGSLTVGAQNGLDLTDASALLTFNGTADQTITHPGNATIAGGATVTEDYTTQAIFMTTDNSGTYDAYTNTGTTATSGTGVDAGNGGSGTYAYFEASGGINGETNYLTETFDFSAYNSPQISYYYHMYGANMGSLALQVNTGGGWTSLWSVSGQQQNSEEKAWIQNTISLAAYAGEASCQIRFLATRGAGITSDIALDDIVVSDLVGAITGNFEFVNLTVNNSGGNIVLASAVEMDGALTLTSGDIDASAFDLTLSANATASVGSDASHVIGTMVKTTAATTKFTFPLGDGTYYKSIAITPSTGTSNVWTAQYYNTAHPTPGDQTSGLDASGTNGTPTSGDIDHISAYEWWDIDNGGTAETAIIEMSWVSQNAVSVVADLRIAHFDGTDWDKIDNAAHSGTAAGGSMSSSSAVSTFSPFTLGSSSSTNVLPIELVSFTGEKKDNRNILNWTTASEINNAYFTVEKSYNGIDFEWVGTQEGSSPSTQIINYSLSDYNILETLNYYRLKQTDFDGKFEYSKTISIDNRVDNSFKEIIGRTNLLGQEVDEFYNGIVIVRYKDGTSQKFYQFK